MEHVPDPKVKYPFASKTQRVKEYRLSSDLRKRLLDENYIISDESKKKLIEVFRKSFEFHTCSKSKRRAKRQGKSCKAIIMHENDVSGQMKRDASHSYLDRPQYTKKSRRLFNQGLSFWNLTVEEEVL